MLTNETECRIQLEFNRNYLKSFSARLKFCHIVSVIVGLANRVAEGTKSENCERKPI